MACEGGGRGTISANGDPGVSGRGLSGPLFLVCAMLAGPATTAAQDIPLSNKPPVQRQKELVRLVRQDCGSCHGLTLAGGLGPALLPPLLRDKPAESLVSTVLYGRPGTPMPPWGQFLSEDEAKWVVEMLLKGFPDEF